MKWEKNKIEPKDEWIDKIVSDSNPDLLYAGIYEKIPIFMKPSLEEYWKWDVPFLLQEFPDLWRSS